MEFTAQVPSGAALTALQRALNAYNASASPISQQQFVQKLVDGAISSLVTAYVVVDLTPLDFQKRFTQAERVAIRSAAMVSGEVADYLDMMKSAPQITLTDPLTIAGVEALEAAGLIEPGRAVEILAL